MLSKEERKAIERIEDFLTTNIIISISNDDTANSEELKAFISKNEYLAIEFIASMFLKQSKEIEELENQRQNGTLSDGYHTYNDLYYQRCVLFATICNLNKNISWKSKKHNDGEKCFNSDEWFIVGIDTPKGSYTYHYEIKYWDMFEVQELEKGKFWDGHTEKDVTRLLSLIDNNISKDKIKAKIEEIKQKQYILSSKDSEIEILQSLLEKE